MRYEYDTYVAYQRELPKVGKTVVTKQGQGKVLSQEILAQKLLVAFEDNRRILIDAADVLTVVGGQGGSSQFALQEQSESDGSLDADDAEM